MKKSLVFTLMLFLAQTSFCQSLSDTVYVEYSKNSSKRLTFGVGIPTTGMSWIFAPNLYNLLDSERIDTWNLLQTVPITINYQKDRFKLSGEYIFSIPDSPRKSQGQFATSSSTQIANLNLGYAIFSERNFFIYFNFGAGYAEFTRNVEIKNSQAISLLSSLQSGFGNGFILNNKGAFFDFNLELMNRPAKEKSIGQSFKLGYRYGPRESSWISTFNSFSETPLDRINNLYFHLALTIPNIRR